MHEADLSLSKYTTARQLDEDDMGPDGYAYGQPKRRRRRWRDIVSARLRREGGGDGRKWRGGNGGDGRGGSMRMVEEDSL